MCSSELVSGGRREGERGRVLVVERERESERGRELVVEGERAREVET